MDYTDIKTYGNAYKVRVGKLKMLILITIICLITPFTNWLIPIYVKKGKSIKYNLRYEKKW